MSKVKMKESVEKSKKKHNSYTCEYGHVHNYDKVDFEKFENNVDERTFDNVDDLKKYIEK